MRVQFAHDVKTFSHDGPKSSEIYLVEEEKALSQQIDTLETREDVHRALDQLFNLRALGQKYSSLLPKIKILSQHLLDADLTLWFQDPNVKGKKEALIHEMNDVFFHQKAELDLRDLNLTEIPYSIGLFTHLLILDLNYNQLNNLPTSIEKCENLRTLILDCNRFTVIPETITKCPLIQLSVCHNRLNQLIDMKAFPELRELAVCYNSLQTLPSSLVNCKKLKWLNASHTGLKEFPHLLKRKIKPELGDLRATPLAKAFFKKLSAIQAPKTSPEDFAKCCSELIQIGSKGCFFFGTAHDYLRQKSLIIQNIVTNELQMWKNNPLALGNKEMAIEKIQLYVETLDILPQHDLNLSHLGLTELPNSLGLLEIDYLDLSHNKIKTFPPLPYAEEVNKYGNPVD